MARDRIAFYVGPGGEINNPNDLNAFENNSWIGEHKYDGIWCLIETNQEGSIVRLSTRTGMLISSSSIVGVNTYAPQALFAAELEATTDSSLKSIENRGWQQAYLFDIIRLCNKDIRNLPLEKRRELLELAFKKIDSKHLVISKQTQYQFKSFFFNALTHQSVEGIVLKRLGSKYKAHDSRGKTHDWVRVKLQRTVDLYVMKTGFTPSRSLNLTVGERRNGNIIEVQSISVPKGYRAKELVGKVIECIYDRKHDSGRYRHLRFNRIRNDKTKEIL